MQTAKRVENLSDVIKIIVTIMNIIVCTFQICAEIQNYLPIALDCIIFLHIFR